MSELLLMAAACFCVWYAQSGFSREIILSDTGVWDLRTVDFSQKIVRFEGKVEYIEDALLTPEEFALRADEAVIADTRYTRARYGTSRIRLLVPEGMSCAISENSPLGAVRIFLNGEWMEDLGRPGHDAESTIPAGAFFYYTLRPRGGVIEIVQQVSNFAHRINESHAGYMIGSVDLMRSFFIRTTHMTALVMGCFLALFFVHLTLWFMFRSYRPNLYFAFFCFVWMIRTAVVERNPFLDMFPRVLWEIPFRVNYLTVPLTIILLTLIMNTLFPKSMPRIYKRVAYTTGVLFAMLSLFMDTVPLSSSLIWYEATTLALLVWYIPCLVIRLWKNRKITLPQSIYLVGVVVFDYACVRDILYQNGIYIFPWARGTIAEISLLLFVFFQTTAMSLDTMSEMNEAKTKEQRLLAENAALSRMNTLRTDLMDTLSHELRTPLAVMMGFAELAAKELRLKGLDRDTTADLDSIASEAQRLANMVSEMRQLSLSRDAAEHRSEFFVKPVIEQTTRLFAPILERRETRLSVSLEENLPAFFGSPDELTQIMFNLLANAWKHTQNGEVRVSVQMRNGEIEVAVSDTGTGISPEFLPRAFERYAHESEDGTGLGLSLCREIVQSYEGEISLASEPGKGTTVTFTLPVRAEKTAPGRFNF